MTAPALKVWQTWPPFCPLAIPLKCYPKCNKRICESAQGQATVPARLDAYHAEAVRRPYPPATRAPMFPAGGAPGDLAGLALVGSRRRPASGVFSPAASRGSVARRRRRFHHVCPLWRPRDEMAESLISRKCLLESMLRCSAGCAAASLGGFSRGCDESRPIVRPDTSPPIAHEQSRTAGICSLRSHRGRARWHAIVRPPPSAAPPF